MFNCMPKATPEIRQLNATSRALATLDRMNSIVSPQEKEETETEEPKEKQEDPPLPRAATAEQPKPLDPTADMSRKRQPSEDFFDYLQRITPEEWSNSQTSGLYLYKKSAKGNVRLTDEPLKCPITLQELREEYYPLHGDGTYRIQFTTGLKHLTGCGENITFDGNGVSLGGAPSASFRGASVAPGDTSFTDAIKATSEMLKDGAKAAVEVSKANQIEQNRPVDVAGIITAVVAAFTAMQPKTDGDSALLKLLEGQRKDAEDRARATKEDAERQRQRDKEEASGQRERDQQFFMMMKQQSDGMNAVLLKQAESKSDTMSQMTNLITSFMSVREKIEDSLGGGQPKGWEGVIGQLIDRAPDAIAGVSALMAARNGATSQQLQALQPQQPQQQPQPQQPQIENDFFELIHRMGKYLSRDTGLWQVDYLAGEPGDDDSDPIPGMIEVEYPAIFQILFVGQPKETIILSINGTEIGKNILAHPQGSEFLHKVIDSIKLQMVPVAESDEIQDPEKPNGRAHRRAQPA